MSQIERLFTPATWQAAPPVTVLTGPEYSYLFFAWLKQALALRSFLLHSPSFRLRQRLRTDADEEQVSEVGALGLNKLKFINLNLDQLALAELKASLSVSLLGQNLWYWLGDLTVLTPKVQRELWLYLSNYQGPHRVVCCMTPELLKELTSSSDTAHTATNLQVLNLADGELTSSTMVQLAQLYAQTYQLKIAPQFLKQLTNLKAQLTLDQYCLLLHYMAALGDKCEQFFSQWLSKIVVLEQTLFDLSNPFWAQKPAQFWTAWEKMGADYPAQFWTAYWSEQLFRAYYFIQFQQASDLAGAKRIGYRLPFSFMQADWRKFNLAEIQQAHNFVRQIDFELKSGASEVLLELFHLKWFNREFIQT